MSRRPCAHGVGGRSIVVALACAALVALGVSASPAAARPACADAILEDWTRGALDSSYAPECYEAAIDALPEDLRAYTTAADDITRARIAASRAADDAAQPRVELSSRRLAGEIPADDPLRTFPTEVAILAAVLTVLGSCGLVAALVRRRRGR